MTNLERARKILNKLERYLYYDTESHIHSLVIDLIVEQLDAAQKEVLEKEI